MPTSSSKKWAGHGSKVWQPWWVCGAREALGSEAQVPRNFLLGEAERRQLNEVAQQLEQELRQAQESLASVGQQLEAARQGQQESTEEAASLRQELTQQQRIYGQGGQGGQRGNARHPSGWAAPDPASHPHCSTAREGD